MNETASTSAAEADLAWIREAIGDLNHDQEQTVRQALTENAPGVHRLAADAAADPKVRSIVAIVLTGIREGRHNQAPRPNPRAKKAKVTAPLDAAHKLFTGKLRDLDSTPWEEDERIEFAIDYALDHCGAYGQSVIATEAQLRNDLRVPRYAGGTEPIPNDPARNTPHVREMIEAHRAEPVVLIADLSDWVPAE